MANRLVVRYNLCLEVGLEVRFRTKKLEQCYRESARARREFGQKAGRRYIERINIIKVTPDLATLMKLPALRCHPLKGGRAGQWAVTLIDRYRLIFTFQDDEMTVVRVEEVSKHYDD